jgi:hypothetical protein
MNDPPNYAQLARTSTREAFIAACPFPLLLGEDNLLRPRGPTMTVFVSNETAVRGIKALTPDPAKQGPLPMPVVLAVCKVQKIFPNMITVGRTANNDIVLPDVRISKLHAFFCIDKGKTTLSDAGSNNGTWVDRRPLVAKGPPQPVTLGDAIRFSELEFLFLDAGSCWDRLRAGR